nr:MAG TPA: hypothetical protein [Caudoviricetes sp.]
MRRPEKTSEKKSDQPFLLKAEESPTNKSQR